MTTLLDVEKAVEQLPLEDCLRLYADLPKLIGRNAEDMDWQHLALERFFQDDSSQDNVYDKI